jgi:hypothetical protein
VARPGVHRFELWFSGEEIRRSGQNGPFTVHAELMQKGIGTIGRRVLDRETPAYQHLEFGEMDARMTSIDGSGVDRGADGLFRAFETSIVLDIREPGDLVAQMRLSKEGETIAYSGGRCAAGTCADKPLALRVPGEVIEAAGLDGPWTLTVELFDQKGLRSVDAVSEEIRGSPAASFAVNPPAVVAAPR